MRRERTHHITLFVCERSGGHLFPALSLAREMRRRDTGYPVFFVTSAQLKLLIRRENFPVYGRGFRRRNLILELCYRFWEAPLLLCRCRPAKVFGFGGRDSFFLMLWAVLLRMGPVLYEPNSVFGRANKILSPFMKRNFCGFRPLCRGRHIVCAGIPVRDDLQKLPAGEAKEKLGFGADAVVLTVCGGSQGSQFLNDLMMKLALVIPSHVKIVHITGRRGYTETRKFYERTAVRARVLDFCTDMSTVYSATDVIISRSGAMTLGEIIYFQIPPVFIPHPGGFSHQYRNADFLQQRNAAAVFRQNEIDFQQFTDAVSELLTNPLPRKRMAEQLAAVQTAVSARKFYDRVFE
ncbi:MAG: hypothetical protein GF333_05660 [Candidatus Omnitrophica bacterium]|nr:hypothetical protein [Candidatus Omnitrophota bacterium]